MWCRVSPESCGVSPATLCSSENVPVYLVPTAEPSSLCMAKTAFLATFFLFEGGGGGGARFTGQSSHIFHEMAPTWHTHPLPLFWASADHVFRIHPEQNQLSPVFVWSSAYRGLSWNVASTKFFPIFRLCHAVDPVTQDSHKKHKYLQFVRQDAATVRMTDSDGRAGN
jgi:hypothetical protein